MYLEFLRNISFKSMNGMILAYVCIILVEKKVTFNMALKVKDGGLWQR